MASMKPSPKNERPYHTSPRVVRVPLQDDRGEPLLGQRLHQRRAVGRIALPNHPEHERIEQVRTLSGGNRHERVLGQDRPVALRDQLERLSQRAVPLFRAPIGEAGRE